MYALSAKRLDDLTEDKEDVEMVSATSKNKKAIFSGLDSDVEYVIKVCTMINGCIISKKCVTLKHER